MPTNDTKIKLCHQTHNDLQIPCSKTSCKFWLDLKSSQNCCVIASAAGPMTLQEIGDIFGVSRMRVCQIEKSILRKMKDVSSDLEDHM